MTGKQSDIMTLPEFLRIVSVRAPNLMWFLGAGASASSGIPTAGDMIWDFKRRIYCTEQRVSIRACEDLSDDGLRTKIQRYLDSRGDCPLGGSDEEYSEYFSMTFTNESDRRRYIDQMLAKATPSFGFLALAVLMKLEQVRLLWTTNFDRNVEDASAAVLKTTSKLIVGNLDAPHLMREAILEGRWPALGKLHGDFQSRRLKNTAAELQTQDALLRCELVDACKRFGLVVCGYSGRDNSVMTALSEAIEGGKGFPAGLFWFSRSEPSSKVKSFVEAARSEGVDAHLIEVPTFDELLADIIAQLPSVPKDDLDLLNTRTKRLREAPLLPNKGRWPVVRLNALEVLKLPSVCRLIKCQIGGIEEVFDAVESSKANIIAARKKAGVILFGSDAEAEKAFKRHQMEGLDVYSIEPRRLWYDSAEAGLLISCLAHGLARERGLIAERKRGQWSLRINSANQDWPIFKQLKHSLSVVTGTVPTTGVAWAEAIEIRLAYRLNRVWLIIEPMVWVSKPDTRVKTTVREFQRERVARRYNRQANDLLFVWCQIISAGQSVTKVATFGIGDGIDAIFEIGDTTAFSRRWTP